MIKIYIYANNVPEFIPYQLRSLHGFLEDDFEYVVFNNSPNLFYRLKNKYVCRKLGIQCIDIGKADHSTSNLSHATALQWSFHEIIKHQNEQIAVILDFDMFLVKKFSIRDYLKGSDIAGTKQNRKKVNYLWPGILFMDFDKLPNKDDINFMCGYVDKTATDVGGFLHFYFKQNPKVKVRNILHTSHIHSKNNNLNVLPKKILERYDQDYCFELYENSFLHFGRGSNWDNKPSGYLKKKKELAFYFIEGCINGDIVLPKSHYVFEFDNWKQKPMKP